jgi:hypothetical protein
MWHAKAKHIRSLADLYKYTCIMHEKFSHPHNQRHQFFTKIFVLMTDNRFTFVFLHLTDNERLWNEKIVDEALQEYAKGRAVLILFDDETDTSLLDNFNKYIRGRNEELKEKFLKMPRVDETSMWEDPGTLVYSMGNEEREKAIFNAIRQHKVTLVSRTFGRGTGEQTNMQEFLNIYAARTPKIYSVVMRDDMWHLFAAFTDNYNNLCTGTMF